MKEIKLKFKDEEYKQLRAIAKKNKISLKGLIYNLVFTGTGSKGLMKVKL